MNLISNTGIQVAVPGQAVLACGGPVYINHLLEICFSLTFLSVLVLGRAYLICHNFGRPSNLCRLASASRWWGMAGLLLLNICAWSMLFHQAFRELIFEALIRLTFLAAPLTALATVVAANRARRKIQRSMGELVGTNIASSSLHTGYATILLCVLLVVTVNSSRFRVYVIPARNACISNLRQISEAKERWALENKRTATDTPTMTDLVGTDKYIKVTPRCPAGGTFTLGNLSTKPRCRVDGHTLP